MAMNTQTELYRGYGKVGALSHQTAAECKFSENAERVIASHASVTITSAEAGNGEVRYAGKVHFLLVYADGEKRICRAEKGVEFSARAEDGACVPAFTARALATVENIAVRREGAGIFLTALIGTDISLYGERSFEYLTGGDLIIRREPAPVFTAHLVGGTAEADDEFETPFISDVLLHSERVGAIEITVSAGTLRVEGEVNLGILALKEGGVPVSFERLVPFNMEIPCDDAAPGRSAEVRVSVVSSALKADADEEKGTCTVGAELVLGAEGCIFEETEIDAAKDAFSRTHEVKLAFREVESCAAGDRKNITQRVSGRAALSSPVSFSDTLLAVTLARAEANLVKGQEGASIEGVALATLLVRGAEGDVRGIEMSLPFSLPVEAAHGRIDVLACSMNARQKQEGEIDAEATLKITLSERRTATAKFIAAAEEGEALPINDSAVSVYIPRAGDGLWELSKSLKKSPEEVTAGNPELEFPIKEGQRVIIYRKKSLFGE